MSVIYEDKYVICDDDAITIKLYYFPVGSKRIAYNSIRSIKERNLAINAGKIRLWGMDFAPEWFHWDLERPQKSKCIVIDEGEWIKAAITPENHQSVLNILQEKIS